MFRSFTRTAYEKKKVAPEKSKVASIAMRLFLTCWLVYTLHFATNTVREIYPALSLGDHLSFDVSEYAGLHPDIFELPGRGVFINNNPGASILGAIPYTLARPVIDRVVASFERARAASDQPAPEYDSIYPMAREFYQEAYRRGLDVKFGLAAGVMQIFLMAPVSALSVVVMFYILLYLKVSQRKALFLAVLYAFATPVFYRTAQLNHNLLVAHSAFFAFVLLWRPWDDAADPGRPKYLLAGLLTGWALVLDYSGALVILFVGVYALARWWSLPSAKKSIRDLIIFSSGVAASVSVLLGYQWLAFGNPIYPAQRYMPATQFSVYGYNGMSLPQLDLLWENAFGMRFGLFTSAPILILALLLPFYFRRRAVSHNALPPLLGKKEFWFVIAFTLAFFLFTAANQFSRLQFNSGVRHVVPVIPFVFLLAADVLLRMPLWLAAITAVLTTYWSWCLAMYRDVEQGLGIPESIIHITRDGLQLPWLKTMDNLGFLPSWVSANLILAVGAVLLLAIWIVRIPYWQKPKRLSALKTQTTQQREG
jgi:hypothetical protein